MDSTWTVDTPPASLKFEKSPAESFLSASDDTYPSLFSPGPSSTMNPLELMTPPPFSDTKPESSVAGDVDPSETGSPAPSEKKPTKKRKSWGQVLPEPKTNLPPRKRAKTEDEKEQRRVERVLRNRRAAQSSRERKRQEVENLERRNKELEAMLQQAQQANMALVEQLHHARRSAGVAPRASQSLDALRSSPVTFSQELFSSQDGHNPSADNASPIEKLLTSVPLQSTVNPASLSPATTPIPEEEDDDAQPATESPMTEDAGDIKVEPSPDATQHPAAMLCDLQCRSAEAPPSWLVASRQKLPPALALLMPLQVLLACTSTVLSTCQRPLTQISMAMKANFSLPPTPAILNTIIWLVTTPQPSLSRRFIPTSTSTNLLPASSKPNNSRSAISVARPLSRRPSTLRLKSLQKILTSSPNLARPLMDATMAVLRLVSTERLTVDRGLDGRDGSPAVASDGMVQRLPRREGWATWLDGVTLPSMEVLLTLLWALEAEERKLRKRERVNVSSGLVKLGVSEHTPTSPTKQRFVLKVLP